MTKTAATPPPDPDDNEPTQPALVAPAVEEKGPDATPTDSLPAVPEVAAPPATVSSIGNALAVGEEWAAMMDWDDGSATFIEHFGLSMPRLRTDFGRNGKGWVDDLTGEVYRSIEIVILAFPPSRAWWEKTIDEGGGGRPDCSSLDMIAPLPNSPIRQAPLCAGCDKAKWGADGERPACTESVNVLAYDQNGDRFVWLRFAGTGLRPFKDYISALTSRRILPFATGTLVELEERKEGSLEWLVPKFGIGSALTADVARPLREVAKKAMASWQQVAMEMEAKEAGPFDEPTPAASEPYVTETGETF